ncbi:hypothetical protein Esti_003231 [Eimeria stiedai]
MASPVALAACKVVAAILFLLVALTGAVVPFALKRCNVSNRINYLNAFAGGRRLAANNAAFLMSSFFALFLFSADLIFSVLIAAGVVASPFISNHIYPFLTNMNFPVLSKNPSSNACVLLKSMLSSHLSAFRLDMRLQFTSGAFLALGILHIMPEAIELLDELEVNIHLNGKPFAVTHLLIFLGYLLILLCEEVLSGGTSHSQLGVEVLGDDTRKVPKGSCTSKSTQSAEEQDFEGPLYALDCGGAQELAVVSQVSRVPVDGEHQVGSSSSGGGSSSSSKPRMQRRTFDSGAFFMMLALAIHGLFEGVIVGAASELSMMWMICAVVLGHKWAEAMLLMCQMMERMLSVQTTALLMGAFSVSSPLGVLIGAILAGEGKLASGICNALGAGTVLYIAGEISSSAFEGCRKARFMEFAMYCSGAALVLGLTLLDVAYG